MRKTIIALGIVALMFTSCKEKKASDSVEVAEDESVEVVPESEEMDTIKKLEVDSDRLEDKKVPLQLQTEEVQSNTDITFKNEEVNQVVKELDEFAAQMEAATKAGDEELKKKLRKENQDLIFEKAPAAAKKLSPNEKAKWQAKMSEILTKSK